MGKGIDQEKRTTLRQFAAVGALSPFTHLVNSPSNQQSEARNAIAGYIATTPGAHFSKIRDDLGLVTGETQYHIRRLVKDTVIESVRDGEYRRFFPAGEFSTREQMAFGYLRRSTPRGIIVALLRNPGLNGNEIAETLGVTPSTVSKYAAELADAGVLSRNEGYVLAEPEMLLVLLVRYAQSFDTNTQTLATEAPALIKHINT